MVACVIGNMFVQSQREEAEAQAAIEAEKVRIERERVMAQNQQERMERKKVGGESPFQLAHYHTHCMHSLWSQ